MNCVVENLDVKKCTGCLSCYNVCKHKAIQLKTKDGFVYPSLIKENCIGCGKCSNVCNEYHSRIGLIEKYGEIFACQLCKNENELLQATSGGAFYAIGKYVIENGGVVFGAGYDDNMVVNHYYVESSTDLVKFSGSKYVQSNLNNTFEQTKKFLGKGKLVLFSGTPCQIAALYDYLGDRPDNLITIDIICYGVPSPMLLSETIKYYAEKYKHNVIDYRFRDKRTFGWSHTTYIKFDNNKVIENIDPRFDTFYRLWKDYTFRECCYECRYINERRVSDFTIGNYWGIEKETDMFDVSKGVSLVVVNSDKASTIFEHVRKNLLCVSGNRKNVMYIQHGMKKPKTRPKERDTFYEDLIKLGIKECEKKYNRPNLIKNIILHMPHLVQYYILLPFKFKRLKCSVKF